MSGIFANGRSKQSTSYAMITTVYDVFTQSGVRQSTPTSSTIVTTPPTFAGIQSLVPQLNGSLLASWNAGSSGTQPLAYDIYIQIGSATGLFVDSNRVKTVFGLSDYLFQLQDGTLLVSGSTYYVGVKARDPLGNTSTNTNSTYAVSTGVQPSRALAPTDIPSIVAAVWDEIAASHTTSGTFGSYLDAKVSTRATQASVNAIPTNPLLTTDSRLNTLDANISSRATQTSLDTFSNKVGTPIGVSIAADIASVQSTSDTINNKVGSPVGISISADIAAVQSTADHIDGNVDVAVSTRSSQSSVDTINTKVGTPTGASVSADIAAVKSDTNTINTKIGTPVGVSVSADIATVQSVVDTIDNNLGTPTGASVSADIADIKADTTTTNSRVDVTLSTRATQTSVNLIPTNPLLTTDSRLNRIDVNISSRADGSAYTNGRAALLDHLDADVTSRSTQTSVDALQATVNNIQGQNVDESIIAPASMSIPSSGTETYRIYFKHAQSGLPVDPIVGPTLSIREQDGSSIIISPVAMTNETVGVFYYDYTLTSSAFEGGILIIVTHADNISDPLTTTILGSYQTQVNSDVTQIAIDTNTLVTRLTATRANNLDNLDVAVSTRATQTSVNALTSTIGTPTGASVSADIAAVQSTADHIDGNVDVAVSTRASQTSVNTINTKIGTPTGASVSADIAAVKSDTGTINSRVDVTLSTRATQTSITALSNIIGPPTTTSIAADLAAMKAVVDTINGRVDVTLSTRATQTSVDDVPTALENAAAIWSTNINDFATGTTAARTLKDAKIFSQIDL